MEKWEQKQDLWGPRSRDDLLSGLMVRNLPEVSAAGAGELPRSGEDWRTNDSSQGRGPPWPGVLAA